MCNSLTAASDAALYNEDWSEKCKLWISYGTLLWISYGTLLWITYGTLLLLKNWK